MKNKILIPLVLIGALAAFFSFKYSSGDTQTGDDRKILTQETVMKAIGDGHFSPRELNDSFSYRVFHKLLDQLDGEKKFFTQADIKALGKYEYQIDDEIKGGSIEFYNQLNSLYTKRLDDVDKYWQDAVKTPFTFTQNDSIELTGKNLTYPANDKALQDRWREYMKWRVLAKYVDLKKDREKKKENKDSVNVKLKTDVQLEADARESVRKSEQSFFKRLHKMKDDDRFSLYVNAITNTEDPHTDYFPPKEKEAFDQAMSGTFYGIGAQLRDDGTGKIKVVAIITGSPSWKEGQLKADDEITKVAQGDKEPVDITGYEIDDVVQLIRGKKGTEVRLTVKKVDGSVKVIPIIRGEVLLEETFARSVIINSKEGPVGYIYLPEFYSDFQHINGRRCADDVANEVKKLKDAGVKGMILDLRSNPGGSLSDVVDMAGVFVGGGPVVQVKSNDAAPVVLRASARQAIYDGPMAVMINEGSASASEIMAAALQDYKRAVIVGSNTYGKGTVQKIIPLDEFLSGDARLRVASGGQPSIGSLKITVQKFYRVNGGSTQLKGVKPDIMLPDPYELIENGERDNKSALGWDVIAPANYVATNSVPNLSQLENQSTSRVAANPTFTLIKESAKRFKQQEEDNTYSLNEVKFRKEQEQNNATSKKLEDLQKKTTAFEFTNLKDDLTRINADSSSVTKNKDWIKNLKKDIYISETVDIVNDMEKAGQKMSMNKE